MTDDLGGMFARASKFHGAGRKDKSSKSKSCYLLEEQVTVDRTITTIMEEA
jgi:hypothetical protein